MSPERRSVRRSSSGSPFSEGSAEESRCSRRWPLPPRLSVSSAASQQASWGPAQSGGLGETWNLSPSCSSVLSPFRMSSLLRLRRVPGCSLDLKSHDFRTFRAAVLANCLCAAMLDTEVLEIAQRAELFKFWAGDRVVSPGDFGSHFFVVQDGRLSCQEQDLEKENEERQRAPCSGLQANPAPGERAAEAPPAAERVPHCLGPGDSFGELAALHGTRHRLLVQAEAPPAGSPQGSPSSTAESRLGARGASKESSKESLEVASSSKGEVATLHGFGLSRIFGGEEEDVVCSCWGVERSVFNMMLRKMAERVYGENLALLDRVRFFQYLNQRQRRIVCRTVVVQLFERGKLITSEGLKHMDCLFVVKSGLLEVSIGGRPVTTLKEGDEFGERAWLYQEPRSATVAALEPSSVLVVRRELLEQVLGNNFMDLSWRNVIHVALRDFLQGRHLPALGFANLKTITDAFIIRSYPPKSDVVKGEHEALGFRLVVVLNGEVLVRAPGAPAGAEGARLGRGGIVGEEYLLDLSKPFQHSIENVSEEPCDLAVLSRDAVAALAAWGLGEELSRRQKMELIRKVYIFRHLSNHHCYLVADSFRSVRRQRGDVAVREGEIGSQFFIIKSGEVVVTVGGATIRTLGKSDYFGERGLLYAEPRSATVTVQSAEAEFLVIDKVVFNQIVEGKMMQHLEERIRLQQTDVSLEDLKTIRTIGRGTFGVVRLVEHRSRGVQYALKCINRAEAVRNGQQEALHLEREILLENDHPFIVQVVRTFQDKRYLYFLTELVVGGELYKTMRDIGLLSKPQAQFYAGGLLLALESLHERCIAYRDLKPENVLLDSQGFTKLIDFGCAKKLTGHTYTLVGTPHYMAPEVICGFGYGLSCDVWSLGVCLYELICGPLPFASSTEEPVDVFRQALTAPLAFPVAAQKDKTAVHIMRGLLKRPLESRLGCSRGICWRSVRKHPYFKSFDFERLLSRQLDPPLVPTEPTFASSEDEGAMYEGAASDSESGLGSISASDEGGEGAAEARRGRGGQGGPGAADSATPGGGEDAGAGEDAAAVACEESERGSSRSSAAFSDVSRASARSDDQAARPARQPPVEAWFRDF
mmetsp:Transcript_144154/g.461502  ORF Transcript_144154/g.461502 Transcript_144154/m.461502 type:complete len:1098 (-) Transcript_144154:74-3367(-)